LNPLPHQLVILRFHSTDTHPIYAAATRLNQLFTIFSLTEAEVKRISAAPDAPHYHDYEELIIGMEGQIEHFIDFKLSILQAPFDTVVTIGNSAL
jgi:hypothetical protein